VNFFAHAVLASERCTDIAFVLGAMLPDLCDFARVRLAAPPACALGDGVRFHHASDAAFHAHRVFAARCSLLSRELETRGVRRGPARGASHVASELLLDGWLARETGVPAAYRTALASAGELLRGSALDADVSGALPRVCARIHASPLPEAYGDASFVCERVERALASRPFLAFDASELPALEAALVDAREECVRWAPGVLDGVRAALASAR
jgi:hypothetical protein